MLQLVVIGLILIGLGSVIKGIYNKVPSKALSDVVTANMREIGTPSYTE